MIMSHLRSTTRSARKVSSTPTSGTRVCAAYRNDGRSNESANSKLKALRMGLTYVAHPECTPSDLARPGRRYRRGRWVRRLSASGHPYEVCEFPLPRVPDQWLDAVVYIYPTRTAAEEGDGTGATGFVVALGPEESELPSSFGHHYVVTNSHAVEKHASVVVRINKKVAGFDLLEIKHPEWLEHPDGDDVVAAALSFNTAHKYAAVDASMLPTPEALDTWGYGPGDEVFFLGRYVDLEGHEHNEPVMRTGVIAGLPSEPVSQRPMRDHAQESILVEARSLSGFSGSPVFVTPSPVIARTAMFGGTPAVRPMPASPCYLLGIDWGHHSWADDVWREREGSEDEKVADLYVRGNSGMMMVVPTAKLLDVLNRQEFVDMRHETEEREPKRPARPSIAVLDTAASPNPEWDSFEGLTRDLVNTPKAEVDETAE